MSKRRSVEKFTDNEVNNKNISDVASVKELSKADYVVVNNSPAVKWLFDFAHLIIIGVVLIVLLLTFVFRIVSVDGRSMMNTLFDGDKLIITNFFYTPEDNDIVVISHAEKYDKPIIKRVIATEGQTLKIDFENERVYVDGTLIDEPYVSSAMKKGNAEIPSVIPEGKVFVMGDNRYESLDSRSVEIGLIDEESIIGKAQFIMYPFDRVQYLY